MSAGVILAPIALAIGPEVAALCLPNPPGCVTVAAEIGTGGAAVGSMPSGAANAANSPHLAKQLEFESDAAYASSLFTKSGDLTAETIARSKEIMKGTQMGNEHLKKYFADHGGADIRHSEGKYSWR